MSMFHGNSSKPIVSFGQSTVQTMDKFLTQTQCFPAVTCWAISMRTIGPLLFRLPEMCLPFAPFLRVITITHEKYYWKRLCD